MKLSLTAVALLASEAWAINLPLSARSVRALDGKKTGKKEAAANMTVCQGEDMRLSSGVCEGGDASIIGLAGASALCNGDEYTCSNSDEIDLGHGSCNGEVCYQSKNIVGGNYSCNGYDVCSLLSHDLVLQHDGTCNGYDTCYKMGSKLEEVGIGSCNGLYVCAYSIPEGNGSYRIGDYSCISGEEGCIGFNNMEVGKGSCIGVEVCHHHDEDGEGDIKVGNKSCNGYDVCVCEEYNCDIEIGSDACNGYSCCYQDPDDDEKMTIKDGSCNGNDCCYNAKAFDIKEDSCNGDEACYVDNEAYTLTVGTNACNGINTCSNQTIDHLVVADGYCNCDDCCNQCESDPVEDIAGPGGYSCD